MGFYSAILVVLTLDKDRVEPSFGPRADRAP
jgi:hypothetical protein